jgi:hypothetical protein
MKHASLLALALALVACGDDDRPIGPWIDAGPRPDGGYPFRDSGLDGGELPDSGTDAGGPPRGRVRFASLSRALGPVDVYAPESPIALARGVAYRGASGYAPLEAGEHELLLRRTGDAPTAEPIATIELTIDEGSEQLVALGGTADALVTWIVDDVEAEPPLGFASATVIHAMDGLGVAAADLDADRALDLEDLAPAARVDGISVPATGFGSAVVAGDARTELSFTWSSGIEEGSTIVLALVGEVGGNGVDAPGLLAILPEAAGSTGTSFLGVDPEVALLQASRNVLDAEVQVGEIPFGTLAYGDLIAPRRVAPGNAYVNVVGRDAEGELVFAGNTAGDLVRGERYLVVLGGPVGFRGAYDSFVAGVDRDGTRAFTSVIGVPDVEDELFGLVAGPERVAVIGRHRRELGRDNVELHAMVSELDHEGRTMAVTSIDLEDSALAQTAAYDGDSLYVGGTEGWRQNPSGRSVFTPGSPFLVRLSGPTRRHVQRVEGVPATSGHAELRTMLFAEGRWLIGGHENGPLTHTADADPSRVRSDAWWAWILD